MGIFSSKDPQREQDNREVIAEQRRLAAEQRARREADRAARTARSGHVIGKNGRR
jgi:hypothetical protein